MAKITLADNAKFVCPKCDYEYGSGEYKHDCHMKHYKTLYQVVSESRDFFAKALERSLRELDKDIKHSIDNPYIREVKIEQVRNGWRVTCGHQSHLCEKRSTAMRLVGQHLKAQEALLKELNETY